MDEKKLPLGKVIAFAWRPLRAGGRALLSFAGLEEGRLRPRAAVLGALVAALAIGALLLQGDTAQAQLPTTTTELDQAPNKNSSVAPGALLDDYLTAKVNITTALSTGSLTIRVSFDNTKISSTSPTTVSCTPAATASGVAAGTAFCRWATPSAGDYTLTLDAFVNAGSGTIAAPSGRVCHDSDSDNRCADEPPQNRQALADAGNLGGEEGDVGTLKIEPSQLVMVDPASDTNLVGVSHTIRFTLAPNVTCQSDPDDEDTDTVVDCSLADVNVPAGMTVRRVTVSDKDLGDPSYVTVVVVANDPGDYTISLDLTANWGDDPDRPEVDFTSPAATKVYVTSAAFVLVSVPDPDHWNVIGSDHPICVLGTDDWEPDGDESIDDVDLTNQFDANADWTGETAIQDIDGDGLDDLCIFIRSTRPGETVQAQVRFNDPDLGGTVTVAGTFIKEWSELVDSAVITLRDLEEAVEADLDVNDVDVQHDLSIEGQTISWPVDWPLIVLEVSHGEHQTAAGTVHVPVDHAEVEVEVDSPRGCTSAFVLGDGESGPVDLSLFDLPDIEHGGELILITADCEELATVTVIEDYPNPVSSEFRPVLQTFRVNWITIEAAKQPLIRKAGEKIILEIVDPDCQASRVEWVLSQGSPGQLIAQEDDEEQNGNDHVSDLGPEPDFEDLETGACVWDVMAHSEDPGQMDVEALVYNRDGELLVQHPLVVWWVKIFSVSTTFVPGTLYERIDPKTKAPTGIGFDEDGDGIVEPDEGLWAPEPAVFGPGGALPEGDQRFETRIVSDHALVRVQVRDFIYLANRSGRPDTCLDMDGDGDGRPGSPPGPYPTTVHEGCPDPGDEAIEGGYWVLPDDFETLAGFLPALMRRSWDSLFGPPDAPEAVQDDPGLGFSLIGPKRAVEHVLGFAWFDYNDDGMWLDWDDVDEDGIWWEVDPREAINSIWPNGLVNIWDAQMPLEKVTLAIPEEVPGLHSGLLLGVDKRVVYPSGTNPYYQVNIPAHHDIPVADPAGGYDWNSFISGPYPFWHPLQWLEPGKVMQLYTDNRGQAMALVLGDKDLTFEECARNPVTGAPECSRGDKVGATAVVATVDYPYHRGKHRDMRGGPAVETWTWGGYKSGVDAADPDLPALLRQPHIVPTDNPAFKYLVVHLKDRDGRCDNRWPGQIDPQPGRNGVRGEPIDFRIDSPAGVIIDAALDGTIIPGGKEATGVRTGRVFSGDPRADDDFDAAKERHFAPFEEGECQAWVLIQNSTNQPANVSITYHDPEGDIVIDVLVPGVGTEMVWGDVDCDGDVDAVDALKVLRYVAGLPVLQTEPCPDIGSTVTVDGVPRRWGDVDGDGDVDAVDALKILRHVVGLPVSQEPGTPPIGSTVRVS